MKKQIDDVEIEHQSGDNIIINVELDLVATPLSQDKLCIVHNIECKDEDTKGVIRHVEPLDVNEETHDQANCRHEHKDKKSRKEVRTKTSKIRFGTTCKYGHSKEDENGNANRKHHG